MTGQSTTIRNRNPPDRSQPTQSIVTGQPTSGGRPATGPGGILPTRNPTLGERPPIRPVSSTTGNRGGSQATRPASTIRESISVPDLEAEEQEYARMDNAELIQECQNRRIDPSRKKRKFLVALIIQDKLRRGEIRQSTNPKKRKREEPKEPDESWDKRSTIGIKLELKELGLDREGTREALVDVLKSQGVGTLVDEELENEELDRYAGWHRDKLLQECQRRGLSATSAFASKAALVALIVEHRRVTGEFKEEITRERTQNGRQTNKPWTRNSGNQTTTQAGSSRTGNQPTTQAASNRAGNQPSKARSQNTKSGTPPQEAIIIPSDSDENTQARNPTQEQTDDEWEYDSEIGGTEDEVRQRYSAMFDEGLENGCIMRKLDLGNKSREWLIKQMWDYKFRKKTGKRPRYVSDPDTEDELIGPVSPLQVIVDDSISDNGAETREVASNKYMTWGQVELLRECKKRGIGSELSKETRKTTLVTKILEHQSGNGEFKGTQERIKKKAFVWGKLELAELRSILGTRHVDQSGNKDELIARLKSIYLSGSKGNELITGRMTDEQIRDALEERWEMTSGDRQVMIERLKNCEWTPENPKPKAKTLPNGRVRYTYKREQPQLEINTYDVERYEWIYQPNKQTDIHDPWFPEYYLERLDAPKPTKPPKRAPPQMDTGPGPPGHLWRFSKNDTEIPKLEPDPSVKRKLPRPKAGTYDPPYGYVWDREEDNGRYNPNPSTTTLKKKVEILLDKRDPRWKDLRRCEGIRTDGHQCESKERGPDKMFCSRHELQARALPPAKLRKLG